MASSPNPPKAKTSPGENPNNTEILAKPPSSDLDGWTLVTRKKKKDTERLRNPNMAESIHPHNKAKLETLFTQRHRFRCFRTGHIKESRETMKCFQCSCMGHSFKKCPKRLPRHASSSPQTATNHASTPSSSSSSSPSSASFPVHNKYRPPQRPYKASYAEVAKKSPYKPSANYTSLRSKPNNTTFLPQRTPPMAVPNNWQNSPLPNNDDLTGQCQGVMSVYLPPRDALHQNNLFLARSAFILVGQHYNSQDLPCCIAAHLAQRFYCHPNDFTIRPVDPNFGDFISVCPNTYIHDLVDTSSPYFIQDDIQIQVEAWSHGSGMVYNPTTHRVTFQLFGAPLHEWNSCHIRALISSVGIFFVKFMVP